MMSAVPIFSVKRCLMYADVSSIQWLYEVERMS